MPELVCPQAYPPVRGCVLTTLCLGRRLHVRSALITALGLSEEVHLIVGSHAHELEMSHPTIGDIDTVVFVTSKTEFSVGEVESGKFRVYDEQHEELSPVTAFSCYNGCFHEGWYCGGEIRQQASELEYSFFQNPLVGSGVLPPVAEGRS
jgi:hypothetical protein